MAIDRDEVRRIAELARLEIPEDKLDRMVSELSGVLDFVATLGQLDLTGLEPTTFASAEGGLRDDQPDGRRLDAVRALAQAPAAEDGFFLVPPIVENLNP